MSRDPGRTEVVEINPDAIAAESDALGIGAGDAPPGTYALVYSLDADAEVAVGALGTARFPAGAYAYVGSAFGSNGLGRVDRHRRVASGAHDVRHWHADYLGGHPETSLDGFGASDCDCPAHLVAADVEMLRSAVVEAFGESNDDSRSNGKFSPERRSVDGA